jgi:hypothetical protein
VNRNRHRRILCLTLASACALARVTLGAAPRVDLEVATEPGFAATDARDWNDLLGQAGFSSIRIRGGTPSDAPTIETRGMADAPSYRVIGILTNGNELVLPKGKFRLADRGKIEAWLEKLRAGGEEAIHVKTAAFGLLPRQLVELHGALAVPIDFSTAGQKPRDVARRIAEGLSLKFITDPAGQRALATDDPVADELQGLSSGTALAAVLRPLGLVLVPEKAQGNVRLRIGDSRAAREHWPVGWPRKGNPRETLPELFKFLNVEIASTPLTEALPAIGSRLKAPILIDHNSLAREGIEQSTKVDLPKTNTFYDRVLDRILFSAGLKYELRVDEADKPFLWVTTLRQP